MLDYRKKWSDKEDEELNTLYNIDMLDIIEISNKMNVRPPYIIAYRLVKLQWVIKMSDVRGFTEYITTSEYKNYIGGIIGLAYSN